MKVFSIKSGGSLRSIWLALGIVLALLVHWYALFPVNSLGDFTHNLSGYAWSDTIGWISFNCTDAGSCGTSPYGVNVDSSGNLSGYAWSDNIGWISFNTSDVTGCPSGSCSPTLNRTSGQISGWARALAGNTAQSGGWDGFISLSGSGYGVTASECSWSGYAWGSDVVGWISFSGSGYAVTGNDTGCALPPTPNVVSENLAASVGPYAEGVPLMLSADVRNAGGMSTGNDFYDDFTYQWDGTGGSWQMVTGGLISKTAISANSTSNDGPISFTPNRTGSVYIQHCVDSNNEVEESQDENPNCTTIGPLTVGTGPSGDINGTSPIDYNTSTTLTWDTSNTDACTVSVSGTNGDSWNDVEENLAGVTTAVLTTDTTYTLGCNSQNLDFVTIDVATDPTIEASPRIVSEGGEVTLTWDTNGQSCFLSGGNLINVPLFGAGTNTDTITAQTTYTVQCPAGQASVMVEILPKSFET